MKAASIVAILAMLPCAAMVHAADRPDATARSPSDAFDEAMQAIYHRRQRDLTDGARPLLIVGRDLTLVTAETTESHAFTPPLYHQLKSICHIVLGVVGAVRR